jgi:EAL and modified HD-GYP domain-containing signal transduction protein
VVAQAGTNAMKTFITKHPILDRQKKIYAYELLSRSHVEGAGEAADLIGELTQVVTDINTLLLMKHLRQGRRMFISTPIDLLLSGLLTRIPSDEVVVKLTGITEVTPEIIAACEKLKECGYELALSLVSEADSLGPLIDLVDFVIVDFLSTQVATQRQLPHALFPKGKRLLAERVEDETVFVEAREMGYQYFQGSFLSRPVGLELRSIPSQKLPYLQLLQEVNQPDFDFGKLDAIIKRDLSLSFSLFHYINSASFATTREVRSVTQALSLLGETAVRRWVSLLAFSEMGKDKSQELLIQAAVRGKFCESIAPHVRLGHRREELFLMGMFSMLDAILDCSLAEALEHMPLARDVKDAMNGVPNDLHDVFQYALAYEAGDWHRVWTYAAKLVTDEALLPRSYLDSVIWVEENLRRDMTLSLPA